MRERGWGNQSACGRVDQISTSSGVGKEELAQNVDRESKRTSKSPMSRVPMTFGRRHALD